MPEWKHDRYTSDCTRTEWRGLEAGTRYHALLTSDHHVDNAHCDHATLRNHLAAAVEVDAPIFVFGDLFCAMQGKWDKRADMSELLPELRGSNYLDRLVDFATEFYRPYASHIAIISNGNHEDSIQKRHETDLTERLVQNLRSIGSPVTRGRYAGFHSFRFCRNGTTAKPISHARTLCYHHGYGGGGEVTRGMIDQNRTRSQYDADIFYSGHIHRRNRDENVVLALDRSGIIIKRQQLFLRGGAYKQDEQGGWQVSRGQAARPLGGWWLRFRHHCTHASRMLVMDAVEATWGKP